MISRATALILAVLAIVGLGRAGLGAESTTPPTSDPAARLQPWTAAEKRGLQEKQDRFYRLDAHEQDRLRELHRQVATDAAAARLGGVMERYAAWLKTLPAGQRADLLSLPPDERLAEIKRLLHDQTTSEMHDGAKKLKEGDAAAVARWVEELVRQREPQLLTRAPMFKQGLEQVQDPRRRMQILMYAAQRAGLGRDMLRPSDEELWRLRESLSPEARQEFDRAQQEGRLGELAESWIRAAVLSKRLGPPVNREELMRFYKEELPPAEREHLENLTPEQMQFELLKRYRNSRLRRLGEGEPPGLKDRDGGLRGWGAKPWFGGNKPVAPPAPRAPSAESKTRPPANAP